MSIEAIWCKGFPFLTPKCMSFCGNCGMVKFEGSLINRIFVTLALGVLSVLSESFPISITDP